VHVNPTVVIFFWQVVDIWGTVGRLVVARAPVDFGSEGVVSPLHGCGLDLAISPSDRVVFLEIVFVLV
jgi:hypothetical protein